MCSEATVNHPSVEMAPGPFSSAHWASMPRTWEEGVEAELSPSSEGPGQQKRNEAWHVVRQKLVCRKCFILELCEVIGWDSVFLTPEKLGPRCTGTSELTVIWLQRPKAEQFPVSQEPSAFAAERGRDQTCTWSSQPSSSRSPVTEKINGNRESEHPLPCRGLQIFFHLEKNWKYQKLIRHVTED